MLLSSDKLKGVHAQLTAFAERAGKELPFDVIVTSGLRTDAEQRKLYAQGRTSPGSIVTNSPDASSSAHGRGAAIDVAPADNGRPVWGAADPRWKQIGDLAKAMGLEWGGDWKNLVDLPHVQVKGWAKLPFAVASSGALLVALGVGVWALKKGMR